MPEWAECEGRDFDSCMRRAGRVRDGVVHHVALPGEARLELEEPLLLPLECLLEGKVRTGRGRGRGGTR